jgi:hypothetical protein
MVGSRNNISDVIESVSVKGLLQLSNHIINVGGLPDYEIEKSWNPSYAFQR